MRKIMKLSESVFLIVWKINCLSSLKAQQTCRWNVAGKPKNRQGKNDRFTEINKLSKHIYSMENLRSLSCCPSKLYTF